ncbi:MAG: hypothetical protein ABFD07_16525 [Methanobacterium sp.]
MADDTFATILIKRDDDTTWTSNNTPLHEGEFGYNTTTGALKIGDSKSLFSNLPDIRKQFSNVVTVAKDGKKGSADFICSEYDSDDECIQAAINSILSTRSTIYFYDGIYNIINLSIHNSNILFKGLGNVLFKLSQTSGTMFSSGTSHYSTSLISISNISTTVDTASYTTTTLTLSTVETLLVGDYLKIVDNTTYGGYYNGEICRVAAIDENTITLESQLYDTYTQSPTVQKISMLNNIIFDNINFIGPGVNTQSSGFSFAGIDKLKFNDCLFSEWGMSAITLTDCINVTFFNVHFRNNYIDGLGYSISLGNACDNIKINSCNFEKYGRHYITVGAGENSIIHGGLTRLIIISNCTFENSYAEAVNTHDQCRVIMIVTSCKFMSCTLGLELSNAVYAAISNNLFLKCMTPVYTLIGGFAHINNNIFDTFTHMRVYTDANIVNNTFKTSGIILSVPSTYQNANNYTLNIKGNTFKDYITAGLQIQYVLDKVSMVIDDNIYDGNSEFIHLDGAPSDNKCIIIKNNKSSGAFNLYYCGDAVISDNIINSSGNGIRIYSTIGTNKIKNNIITASVKAIYLDFHTGDSANSNLIMITNNDLNASTQIYNKNNNYTNVIIAENRGYATENTGTATITASGTSVVVNHGLATTPTNVIVTPRGNLGSVWADTFTLTQFTIHCSSAPASDTVVGWSAVV